MSARKKTRQNAGEGYGYMFHGAFKEKKDAVEKERKTKGAWVKGVLTNQGHRYLVMSERTNPIKRKKNPTKIQVFFDNAIKKFTAVTHHPNFGNIYASGYTKKEAAKNLKDRMREVRKGGVTPANRGYANPEHGYFSERIDAGGGKGVVIWANTSAGPFHAQPRFNDWEQSGREIGKYKTLETARKKARAYIDRNWGGRNPHELLIMGANPHPAGQDITVPPGSTITIRMNPIAFGNPDRYTAARAIASGARYTPPALIQTKRQKRVAGMVRSARKHKYEWIPEEGIAPGQNPGLSTLLDVASIGTSLPALAKQARRKNVELGTYENGVFHPWTRRPKSRQKKAIRRQNPSAEVIREEFTGMPVEHEFVRQEPHMPAGNYAQLGKLLSLMVKPRAGGQVLEIKGDGKTLVVSDESARQLWFVGGDQDVTDSLAQFGALERGANLFELGEARRIDYEQRKEHVPHPDQDHWRHNFGEETNERPKVLFDRAHKRLLFEGGAYEIRREGIVN